uniref:Uncharacterized protein n=1 Tax=Arundo donax TaxID=35708 RepID=A0A0A9EI56_ARUDO
MSAALVRCFPLLCRLLYFPASTLSVILLRS